MYYVLVNAIAGNDYRLGVLKNGFVSVAHETKHLFADGEDNSIIIFSEEELDPYGYQINAMVPKQMVNPFLEFIREYRFQTILDKEHLWSFDGRNEKGEQRWREHIRRGFVQQQKEREKQVQERLKIY